MNNAEATLDALQNGYPNRYQELDHDERKELAIRILNSLRGDHPMTEQFEGVCISLAFDPKKLQP